MLTPSHHRTLFTSRHLSISSSSFSSSSLVAYVRTLRSPRYHNLTRPSPPLFAGTSRFQLKQHLDPEEEKVRASRSSSCIIYAPNVVLSLLISPSLRFILGALQLAFPVLLFRLIQDPEATGAIAWSSCGRGFTVRNSKELTACLPKYFRHSKYSSLQRQVSM